LRPIPLTFATVAVIAALGFRRRLGWGAVGIVLVLAALLAVYGSRVVELPDPQEAIDRVGSTLGAWTYLLVGVLAFLESAAFIGLVAPGEVAVVFGGIIAGRGDIDLVVLIAVVWFAALAGDLSSYAFGRRVGRGWIISRGQRLGVTEARLAVAERYFAAHGGKTIVIGRLVGFVRSLTPFIAGTSKMPFRRFLAADLVGTGLWSVTFCVLGYLLWHSLDRALEYAKAGKLGLVGVLLLVLGGIAAYHLVKHPEDRRRLLVWLRERAAFR
jgi:undecaprenyl-diphosphatase